MDWMDADAEICLAGTSEGGGMEFESLAVEMDSFCNRPFGVPNAEGDGVSGAVDTCRPSPPTRGRGFVVGLKTVLPFSEKLGHIIGNKSICI